MTDEVVQEGNVSEKTELDQENQVDTNKCYDNEVNDNTQPCAQKAEIKLEE